MNQTTRIIATLCPNLLHERAISSMVIKKILPLSIATRVSKEIARWCSAIVAGQAKPKFPTLILNLNLGQRVLFILESHPVHDATTRAWPGLPTADKRGKLRSLLRRRPGLAGGFGHRRARFRSHAFDADHLWTSGAWQCHLLL
jgi:hypothetical protein